MLRAHLYERDCIDIVSIGKEPRRCVSNWMRADFFQRAPYGNEGSVGRGRSDEMRNQSTTARGGFERCPPQTTHFVDVKAPFLREGAQIRAPAELSKLSLMSLIRPLFQTSEGSCEFDTAGRRLSSRSHNLSTVIQNSIEIV